MKLSIIISNRNDTSMLAVTVRSCIEALRPLGEGEIVIVDNSDPEIYKTLNGVLPTGYMRDEKFTLKVYRQELPCIFTARETAAEKATGEYILCLDSHMLIGHNTFIDLVKFMDKHANDKKLGFAHAPISWAHQHERHARHDRDMSVNELGNWGAAYKYEQTITWKGMPWICRREWFLDRDKGLNAYGALAEHRISWGGGDLHIGVKPWLLGFKNWAVPSNPCIHIGPFPTIDPKNSENSTIVHLHARDKYRVYGDSGRFPHTFGFLVSCYILGGEPMMERNKKAVVERFGSFIDVDKWWNKAKEIGEGEKRWLDKRKVMTFEELLNKRPWDECSRNSLKGTVRGAR